MWVNRRKKKGEEASNQVFVPEVFDFIKKDQSNFAFFREYLARFEEIKQIEILIQILQQVNHIRRKEHDDFDKLKLSAFVAVLINIFFQTIQAPSSEPAVASKNIQFTYVFLQELSFLLTHLFKTSQLPDAILEVIQLEELFSTLAIQVRVSGSVSEPLGSVLIRLLKVWFDYNYNEKNLTPTIVSSVIASLGVIIKANFFLEPIDQLDFLISWFDQQPGKDIETVKQWWLGLGQLSESQFTTRTLLDSNHINSQLFVLATTKLDNNNVKSVSQACWGLVKLLKSGAISKPRSLNLEHIETIFRGLFTVKNIPIRTLAYTISNLFYIADCMPYPLKIQIPAQQLQESIVQVSKTALKLPAEELIQTVAKIFWSTGEIFRCNSKLYAGITPTFIKAIETLLFKCITAAESIQINLTHLKSLVSILYGFALLGISQFPKNKQCQDFLAQVIKLLEFYTNDEPKDYANLISKFSFFFYDTQTPTLFPPFILKTLEQNKPAAPLKGTPIASIIEKLKLLSYTVKAEQLFGPFAVDLYCVKENQRIRIIIEINSSKHRFSNPITGEYKDLFRSYLLYRKERITVYYFDSTPDLEDRVTELITYLEKNCSSNDSEMKRSSHELLYQIIAKNISDDKSPWVEGPGGSKVAIGTFVVFAPSIADSQVSDIDQPGEIKGKHFTGEIASRSSASKYSATIQPFMEATTKDDLSEIKNTFVSQQTTFVSPSLDKTEEQKIQPKKLLPEAKVLLEKKDSKSYDDQQVKSATSLSASSSTSISSTWNKVPTALKSQHAGIAGKDIQNVPPVSPLLINKSSNDGLDQKTILPLAQHNSDSINQGETLLSGGDIQPLEIDLTVKEYRTLAKSRHAEAQLELGNCYRYGRDIKQNISKARKWYRKAAEQGSVKAMLCLAFSYEEDTPSDIREAISWHRKAAEQNNAEAQFFLGTYYQTGIGVEKNLEKAVKYYQLAAAQGDAAAQFCLGESFSQGRGIERNLKEAVKYYRRATKQGYAWAQLTLGKFYETGVGVEKNMLFAYGWYRHAAAQGLAAAQLKLGRLYHEGEPPDIAQNLKKAVRWYRRAAKQKDAEARFYLGLCYAQDGVMQDMKKAVLWYEKAAKQGHLKAQVALVTLYSKERNLTAAIYWCQKAAKQGNVFMQFDLARCYFEGTGIEKDPERAVYWYEKAAKQGNVKAQCNLGYCFENGIGVEEQDKQTAVHWYRKAAEQGHPKAQCILGYRYLKGTGVTKNLTTAEGWYRKAAEQNYADAQYELGHYYFFYYQVSNVTQKDLGPAVQWYSKAAEQGHVLAQYKLGFCHELRGDDLVRNTKDKDSKEAGSAYENAVYWYQKAAEQGQEIAQCRLADCYFAGKGIIKNLAAAVDWYQQAAEQNFLPAWLALGKIYEIGGMEVMGVKKNLLEAVRHYRWIADQASLVEQLNLAKDYAQMKDAKKIPWSDAQYLYVDDSIKTTIAQARYRLGSCYEKGNGVEKNLQAAVKYYQQAADQGDVSAQCALDRLYMQSGLSGSPIYAQRERKLSSLKPILGTNLSSDSPLLPGKGQK